TALVARVPDEEAQALVARQRALQLELLVLVPAVDPDPLRIRAEEPADDRRADRAGAAGDQDGLAGEARCLGVDHASAATIAGQSASAASATRSTPRPSHSRIAASASDRRRAWSAASAPTASATATGSSSSSAGRATAAPSAAKGAESPAWSGATS